VWDINLKQNKIFKSIFVKLVLIYISISILSFIALGSTFYYFSGDFIYSEKKSMITGSIDGVVSVLQSTYNQNLSSVFPIVNPYIQRTAASLGAIIVIADDDGNIYPSLGGNGISNSSTSSAAFSKLIHGSNGVLKFPSQQQTSIIADNGGTYSEIGNFFGLFSDTGVSWLTVASEFTINNTPEGNVYVFLPVPDLDAGRVKILQIFSLCALGILILATITIYFVSRRITRPIKSMRVAAQQVVAGKFDKRIEITSGDEIGELSDSFNKMIDGLENLENMRREFISNVSHEIRTPMTSISGFVEGILDGTIPSDRQEYYLQIVKNESDRLNKMLNDLLELVSIESGKEIFEAHDFDICEICKRAIIMFEKTIVEKNIKIFASYEYENIIVRADADSIQRVIMNLIQNAIKFSQSGSLIEIKVYDDGHNMVCVSVKDNGKGMSEEDLKYIWDRFYKADKSRTRDDAGTGLGLAIVKNIIESQSLKIEVKSTIGAGTEFIIYINKGD
jgi:signal transduction histidine kinase